MPSTSSPASISSEDLWETATVVEEGQEDEHLLQKYGHFSSERTDKKTDHRATKQSTNGSRQASQDHHRCLSGQLYLHDTVWFWRRYAGCVRIDYMSAENKVF